MLYEKWERRIFDLKNNKNKVEIFLYSYLNNTTTSCHRAHRVYHVIMFFFLYTAKQMSAESCDQINITTAFIRTQRKIIFIFELSFRSRISRNIPLITFLVRNFVRRLTLSKNKSHKTIIYRKTLRCTIL